MVARSVAYSAAPRAGQRAVMSAAGTVDGSAVKWVASMDWRWAGHSAAGMADWSAALSGLMTAVSLADCWAAWWAGARDSRMAASLAALTATRLAALKAASMVAPTAVWTVKM